MKVKQLSDCTTSDNRKGDSSGVIWTNYQGLKGSREVQATQVNFKDSEDNHFFYNTKTGVQGMAGGNRDKKEKK